MRQLLSFLFGIVTIVLVETTAGVLWLDTTVTNQMAFVNLLAPLARDPVVQDTIAVSVTDQVMAQTGGGGGTIGATARAALARQVDTVVREVLASEQFALLWTSTLQRTHDGLLTTLASADAGNLFIVDGRLVANVAPLVEEVVERLAAEGLPVTFDSTANYDVTVLDSPSVVRSLAVLYELHQALPWLIATTVAALLLTLLAAPFWPGALAGLGVMLALIFLTQVGLTTVLPGLLVDRPAGSDLEALTADAFALILHSLRQFVLIGAGVGAVLWVLGLLAGRGVARPR